MIFKKFAMWLSTECRAGHQVVLFITADCFAPCVFPSGWCFLSSDQVETSSKELKLFGSLAKHLGNTSAYVACAIQHRCQHSLEIPNEITIKTTMTKHILYLKKQLMWGGPIVVNYHVLATKLQGFLQHIVCNLDWKEWISEVHVHHQLCFLDVV